MGFQIVTFGVSLGTLAAVVHLIFKLGRLYERFESRDALIGTMDARLQNIEIRIVKIETTMESQCISPNCPLWRPPEGGHR